MPSEHILNTSEGIARVVNNRALYGKLLIRFTESMADSAEKIQALLAAGDTEEAHRLAHTVKGSAANLSANALAEAARLVELGIAENADVQESLEKMREVLHSTLKEMADFQV